MNPQTSLHIPELAGRIHILRRQRVMLGADLALLYQIPPRVFMQAVKRNIERFPPDFMFQLTPREFRNVTVHGMTSWWGGIRKMPYAFTQQGIMMLAGVLRSRRAVEVSIEVIRSFERLQNILASGDKPGHAPELLKSPDDPFSFLMTDRPRTLRHPPGVTHPTPSSDIASPPSPAGPSSPF